MKKIEKIELPEEPKYESGQMITRIPLLTEALKKINELVEVANRVIDGENTTLMNKYTKYKNKDRCTYPFQPESLGYCWSYANWIDDGKKDYKEFVKRYCLNCEFGKEIEYPYR